MGIGPAPEQDPLAALLGGLGGGGGPAGPGGAPPGAEAPLPPPREEGFEATPEDPDAILREMLDLTRDFIAIEQISEQDRLGMEKVSTIIQQALAGKEKELAPGLARSASGPGSPA